MLTTLAVGVPALVVCIGGDIKRRTASRLREVLGDVKNGATLLIRINSEGGCVYSALAIVDMLRASQVKVVTCVVGRA